MDPSSAAAEPRRPERRQRRKRQEPARQLSFEELQALQPYVKEQLRRFNEAKAAGKPKTMEQIKKEIIEEQRQLPGTTDTMRTVARWPRVQMTPSERLRPGATKMVLRPDEEEELPLHRMGHGNVFSPRKVFGRLFMGKRDFAWGIFAIPERAELALGQQWGGRDPQGVLGSEMYYLDVLRRCHQMEMTLMLLTSRPLPLAESRARMEARLLAGVDRLSGGSADEADRAELRKFVRLFDDAGMQQKGLAERGCLKEGTHLLFTATPKGGLIAEAISPGPIRDRRTFRLGGSRNPLVTGAVFEAFLGLDPVDPSGKDRVGSSLLWCANGFSLQEGGNPNQYKAVLGPDGQLRFPEPEGKVWVNLTGDIFRLVEERTQPVRAMLLGGIRRAQQQLASSAEA